MWRWYVPDCSVGTAVDAVVAWTLRRPGNEAVASVNALVGETNDGALNDIRGQHVTGDDVVRRTRWRAQASVTVKDHGD